MRCSYCSDEMRITTVKEKRPVPVGSKDLNLYDDVTCWQCTKCGQTSKEGLIECYRCKAMTVKCTTVRHAVTIPNDIPISLRDSKMRDDEGIIESYACVNCQLCVICNQPLKEHELVEVEKDRSIGYRGHYFHEYCYAHKRCGTQENPKSFVKNKEEQPPASGFLKRLFGDLF